MVQQQTAAAGESLERCSMGTAKVQGSASRSGPPSKYPPPHALGSRSFPALKEMMAKRQGGGESSTCVWKGYITPIVQSCS